MNKINDVCDKIDKGVVDCFIANRDKNYIAPDYKPFTISDLTNALDELFKKNNEVEIKEIHDYQVRFIYHIMKQYDPNITIENIVDKLKANNFYVSDNIIKGAIDKVSNRRNYTDINKFLIGINYCDKDKVFKFKIIGNENQNSYK